MNRRQTHCIGSERIESKKSKPASWFSYITVVLCCAFVHSATFAASDDGFRIDDAEFNFGQLMVSSFASHTFWIHATGSDTIFIDTVIPGCGCTTIPLSKKILAPGDSVAFEVQFDSKGFSGSVAKRPGFKLVGDSATHFVKFYSSVVTNYDQFFPLLSMPATFSIPETTARSGEKFPFQIHNRSDEDVSISIADLPHELFEIVMPDSIPALSTISGHFSLLPGYDGDVDVLKSVTFEVNENPLYRLTTAIIMKSVAATSSSADSLSQTASDSSSQGGR